VGQTMNTTVVRYQAKPERADENQKLIEAIFGELEKRQPEGFTYRVFRLEDGVTFIHVLIEHDVANVADRCEVLPVATGATIVGGYR